MNAKEALEITKQAQQRIEEWNRVAAIKELDKIYIEIKTAAERGERVCEYGVGFAGMVLHILKNLEDNGFKAECTRGLITIKW